METIESASLSCCSCAVTYYGACSGCNEGMADKAVWANDEVSELLDHLIDKNAYRILDSKRQRNMELFEDVSKALNGSKTAQQQRGSDL